jgi:hypothetical protein
LGIAVCADPSNFNTGVVGRNPMIVKGQSLPLTVKGRGSLFDDMLSPGQLLAFAVAEGLCGDRSI